MAQGGVLVAAGLTGAGLLFLARFGGQHQNRAVAMAVALTQFLNQAKAVELIYLEIFTRRPSADELADAREIIGGGKSPVDGLADLRWAMLNSHEFRYLP